MSETPANYNQCNCIELLKETTVKGDIEFYTVVRNNDGVGTYITIGVNISDEQALDLFNAMTVKLSEPKKEILKRIQL